MLVGNIMKRQKVKWRFQNIVSVAVLCLVLKQAYATLPSTTASPDPTLPVIKGTLKDFTMPQEARFWELHGLKYDATLRKAIERLSQHLVGNSKERSSVFRFCEARSKAARPATAEQELSAERISCLYYEWQSKARAFKMERSKNTAKKAVSKIKTAKKSKKVKKSAADGLTSLHDLKKLKGLGYREILKRIDFRDESAALRSARIAAQESSDCSLTAGRAAVLRDMENHLPSDAVWKAMNELYRALAPCLAPDHEAFEVVNMRLALMHLDRRELNRAASLLEVALQGKTLEEEHSILFWRGYLDHLQASTNAETTSQLAQFLGLQQEDARNLYWDKLVEKYPLTLHSLVVDRINGVDTYDRYASRPSPNVSVYAGESWTFENVSSLIFATFMIRNSQPEMKKLAYLFDVTGVEPQSFENAMFHLKMYQAAGQQRAAIKVIWQALKKHGSDHLSLELLEDLYPVHFRNEIAQQASHIDPALIFSLIRQESSFNPRATSPAGARGLMQVMPATAKRVEKRRNIDLYNPSTNIRIGSKYLSILRVKHSGDYARLIASYNAGPNNTIKWDTRYNGTVPLLFADLIPFPETRHYVSGLMRHMYWYRALVSHVKEPTGSIKINWSWSLQDVVPTAAQFGVQPGSRYQVSLENIPWIQGGVERGTSAAENNP
jgi:hypothetical protein